MTVTGIVRPRPLHPPLTHFPHFPQVNETAVIRLDYGDPTLGTCKETVEGGNHFRYWIQSGSSANRYYVLSFASFDKTHLLESGAVFMAVSYELPEQRESCIPSSPPRVHLSYADESRSRYHFQRVRALPFQRSHSLVMLNPKSIF